MNCRAAASFESTRAHRTAQHCGPGTPQRPKGAEALAVCYPLAPPSAASPSACSRARRSSSERRKNCRTRGGSPRRGPPARERDQNQIDFAVSVLEALAANVSRLATRRADTSSTRSPSKQRQPHQLQHGRGGFSGAAAGRAGANRLLTAVFCPQPGGRHLRACQRFGSRREWKTESTTISSALTLKRMAYGNRRTTALRTSRYRMGNRRGFRWIAEKAALMTRTNSAPKPKERSEYHAAASSSSASAAGRTTKRRLTRTSCTTAPGLPPRE